MQVGSNYSGWEHKDKGHFKNCVDESLVKSKARRRSSPQNQRKQLIRTYLINA
jgi:hypothetical protein